MSSNLAKNTFQYTLALVGQKILAFIYVIVIARLLGVEGNGEYFFAISFAMIFSVFADLGITAVFIREGTQRPDELQPLFSRSFTLRLLNGVMMIALTNFVAWSRQYDLDARMLVAIASVSFFLESLHLLFFAALRTIQNLKYEALILLGGQVLQVALGAVLLFFSPRPQSVVLALLATNIFDAFVAYLVIRKKLGLKLTLTLSARELWSFALTALPFTLAGIFVKIYSYVDSVLLKEFATATALGFYAVAYRFTYAFQFLPLAFVAGLYPAFASLYKKDDERIVSLFERSQWYMSVIAFPIVFGIWAIGDIIIRVFYGDAYLGSVPTLYILIPALAFIFLDFPIGSLLNATHRQNTKTAIMGATVVINIVLNVLLIRPFAERGAAIAGLVSFAFLFIAGLFVVMRMFKIHRLHLLAVYGKTITASLVMFTLVSLLKSQVHYIFLIPAGAVSYVAALFLVGGMRKADLTAFVSLFRKRDSTVAPVTPNVV